MVRCVFILDEYGNTVNHAANPDYLHRNASETVEPNGYPAGDVVASGADEDGKRASYIFTNPKSGAAETKHTTRGLSATTGRSSGRVGVRSD